MTNGCWPTVVILGAPVALARSLVHGLHAAWSRRTDRREDESWPCLAPEPGQAWPAELTLNDIARITLRTRRPLLVDPYRKNRVTGAFILIDEATNETVAAGMVAG